VVWETYNGSDSDIFLYDGTGITQISDNYFSDEGPQINNNGYVVWKGRSGSDDDIFLAKPSISAVIPCIPFLLLGE
jgi:hypothetical protein